MDYVVIIERGPTSWGAYVPDLPGCIAVAESRHKVRERIREAIALHLEDLREEGVEVPQPVSDIEVVHVDA